MKAHLLHPGRDFDFTAALPPGHEDLIQDLELTTLLQAMAAGDKFLYEVSAKVLLASLDDPDAIRYRQRVLADCLAQPEVIRQMYAVAVGALEDKRHLWLGGYGGSYQNASSNLSGAVSYLEAYATRLRQLRQIADDHAGKFRSDGLTALFATLQRELDDEYFEEISDHLKQLRFRAGVLISARLDRDNSGTGFVLRAPADARRRWTERLGIGPRTAYSFTIAPRDEAGEPDPGRPHQPGHQPRRQRRRPVRRPHRQLLHHAPRRAGLLRQLPQPRRQARGQGGTRRGPRSRAAVIAHVLLHRPARYLPGTAVSEPGQSATTCKATGSRWSSSPAPTPEGNPRSCAASAWPSS